MGMKVLQPVPMPSAPLMRTRGRTGMYLKHVKHVDATDAG